jgi:Transposase
MRSLVMSFRGILQSGKTATLARWIKKANRSGIYGMNRFVRKLNHDLAAVKNALRVSWSNGPVGGVHQSAEDPQAPDVWSSRLRTLTSPIAADVPRFPHAPKLRKNLIKEKRHRQLGYPLVPFDRGDVLSLFSLGLSPAKADNSVLFSTPGNRKRHGHTIR